VEQTGAAAVAGADGGGVVPWHNRRAGDGPKFFSTRHFLGVEIEIS
jgi:hypothetical protein